MMYDHFAALVARLGFGLMMIPHGWAKLSKLLAGDLSFADPLGMGQVPTLLLAIFSEFICPIFIVIGFKTRLASVPPAITMIVAALVIHASDSWDRKEFALLYLVGFVCTFLLGSGAYSLDHRLKKV